MAFEVYMDGIETDAIGGFDKVMPGSYHFSVVMVDEEGGKKGEMVVDLEVLRGTTANQVGKVFRVYFRKDTDKPARKMLLAYAIATDLTTKEALDKHKKDETSPTFDWASTVGKQICANLVENLYNGAVKTQISWDEIYHPLDKRASHIPLHVVMLKKVGIELPATRNPDGAVSTAAAPAKPAAAKPATTPPAVSPQQAANVDDLLSGM